MENKQSAPLIVTKEIDPQEIIKHYSQIKQIISASPEDANLASGVMQALKKSPYKNSEELGFIADFLNGAVVKDTFNEHIDRRIFRARMEKENKELFALMRSNKLGLNNINAALISIKELLSIDFIHNQTGVIMQEIDSLDEMIESNEFGYSGLTQEQKEKFVNILSDASRLTCQDFMQHAYRKAA